MLMYDKAFWFGFKANKGERNKICVYCSIENGKYAFLSILQICLSFMCWFHSAKMCIVDEINREY